jgi:DNA-directed RNA polymerase specialized sigma subunit
MNHYEIETCVAGAKNGNNEDLLKVLNQYKPFIFKTASKFNIKNYDIHDLEQIGYMAIMHAVAKYKTGSCTFSSYVFHQSQMPLDILPGKTPSMKKCSA